MLLFLGGLVGLVATLDENRFGDGKGDEDDGTDDDDDAVVSGSSIQEKEDCARVERVGIGAWGRSGLEGVSVFWSGGDGFVDAGAGGAAGGAEDVLSVV